MCWERRRPELEVVPTDAAAHPLRDVGIGYGSLYLASVQSGPYARGYFFVWPYTRARRGKRAKIIAGYQVQLMDPCRLVDLEDDQPEEWTFNSAAELEQFLADVGQLRWLQGHEYELVRRVWVPGLGMRPQDLRELLSPWQLDVIAEEEHGQWAAVVEREVLIAAHFYDGLLHSYELDAGNGHLLLQPDPSARRWWYARGAVDAVLAMRRGRERQAEVPAGPVKLSPRGVRCLCALLPASITAVVDGHVLMIGDTERTLARLEWQGAGWDVESTENGVRLGLAYPRAANGNDVGEFLAGALAVVLGLWDEYPA